MNTLASHPLQVTIFRGLSLALIATPYQQRVSRLESYATVSPKFALNPFICFVPLPNASVKPKLDKLEKVVFVGGG
jgi:hypothetical protein